MLSGLATKRLSGTWSGMPAYTLVKIPSRACRLEHWWRLGVWHARVDSAEDTGSGMPIRTLAKMRGLAYRLGQSWRSPLSNNVNCSGKGEQNAKLKAAWHTGRSAQLLQRSYEKLNFMSNMWSSSMFSDKKTLLQSANSFDQIFFVLIPKLKHKLLSVTSQRALAEMK